MYMHGIDSDIGLYNLQTYAIVELTSKVLYCIIFILDIIACLWIIRNMTTDDIKFTLVYIHNSTKMRTRDFSLLVATCTTGETCCSFEI